MTLFMQWKPITFKLPESAHKHKQVGQLPATILTIILHTLKSVWLAKPVIITLEYGQQWYFTAIVAKYFHASVLHSLKQ